MATYLMLVLLTGQQVFLLMGHYVMALVVEAPNYETMAKAALTMDSLGSMRTETLRAFSEDEYRKILDDIA